MAHNATHVRFRDWCPFCVASRGRSSPHRRVVVNKTADTLPKFHTCYMFIRTVAESKTQPCITFVKTRSGVVISFMCAGKGGYEDLTKEILRHFEAYGFLNRVIIQCDKEMSIIDVCNKVARERNARTVLRFALKTSHQSNGFVEAVHGHIQGLARCYHYTNRDEHWHTAFSNFTCHSICDSLRWICSLKIHSATRRQNPIPIFARNSICITLVHDSSDVAWAGTGRQLLRGMENGLRALRRQAERRTESPNIWRQRMRSFGPGLRPWRRREEKDPKEGKAFHPGEKVTWKKSGEWTWTWRRSRAAKSWRGKQGSSSRSCEKLNNSRVCRKRFRKVSAKEA